MEDVGEIWNERGLAVGRVPIGATSLFPTANAVTDFAKTFHLSQRQKLLLLSEETSSQFPGSEFELLAQEGFDIGPEIEIIEAIKRAEFRATEILACRKANIK